MKSHRFAKVLLAAALVSASSQIARAQLFITEIHSTGNSNGTYANDWFELTNFGSSPVSLTGWRMNDDTATFASGVALTGVASIAAGQSIVFVENLSGSVETAFKNAWFGPSAPSSFVIGGYSGAGVGLSNGGDAVTVFNGSGSLVASVTFGSATVGRTFDNFSGAGTVSLLSSVGINGAFTSFNGAEIGSPGFAPIPEPSSYALFAGVVALGVAAFRRKLATGG